MLSLSYLEKGRSLDGWSSFGEGSIALSNIQPLSNALPLHMRYSLVTSSASASGFSNRGFYGMNILAQNYTGSFFYRPLTGASVTGDKLNVGFHDAVGQTTYGMSTTDVSKAMINKWLYVPFNISVLSASPSTNNLFFVEFPIGSKGGFEFNLISCFPPTFKNRTNGARMDIAQAVADLKPGFIRLAGGNDLERSTIAERF